MPAVNTDVSSAQSFDVNSFFNSLFSAAGTAIAGKSNSPSQNTGQPNATTQPNVTALPGGYVSSDAGLPGGVSQKTLLMVGIGIAAVVVVVVLARKAS